jgi:apolipoprotein D and lipocalin family protein
MRLFCCVAFGWLLVGCYPEKPLEVETDVSLARFEGRWYEIAKLPRHSEKDCTHTTATYVQRSRDELELRTRCNLGGSDGPVKSSEARLIVPDRSEPAKLALDFGFYQGEHWIVELGDDYEYAVVGHPTRQYLWVLSREPTLPDATLSMLSAHAKAQGFPVEDLEFTEQ